MPDRQCAHIKLNGDQCRTSAMRGRKLCYFHARMRRATQAKMKSALPRLLLLEDETSIQGAIMQVIDMLLADQIECKKARLILDAITIACRNVKSIQPEHKEFEDGYIVSIDKPEEGLDADPEGEEEAPERTGDDELSPLPPSIFEGPAEASAPESGGNLDEGDGDERDAEGAESSEAGEGEPEIMALAGGVGVG
jgi:hypothetical protein